MIDDLISRQAAINAVATKIKKWDAVDGKGYYVGLGLRYTDVIDTLTELPSAQPKRKRGEWLENETSYSDDIPQTCTCSVCGIRSRRPLGDFCKSCGADMRDDTDNQTTVCPMCPDCPDNCPLEADMRGEANDCS